MFDPGVDRNGLPCARLRPLVLAEDALSRVLPYVMKTSTDQAALRPKRAFSPSNSQGQSVAERR